MFNPVRSTTRRIAARVAVAGIVGVGGLFAAPAAFASPYSSVALHVHSADVALRAMARAALHGSVAAELPNATAQLGIAARISTKVAIHASTPHVEVKARNAINLVLHEEAKAEGVIGSDAAAAAGAEKTALLKAKVEVTQGQIVALRVLSKLSIESQDEESNIEAKIQGLSVAAKGALVKLVAKVTPNDIGCPSEAAFRFVVASDVPSDVQANLDPVDVTGSLLGAVVDAHGSLLGSLVADETSETAVRVHASVGCEPTDSGTQPTDNGSSSGSGSAGATASASGSESASGSVLGSLFLSGRR